MLYYIRQTYDINVKEIIRFQAHKRALGCNTARFNEVSRNLVWILFYRYS